MAVQPTGVQTVTTVLAAAILWLAASSIFGAGGLARLMQLRDSRDVVAAEAVDAAERIAALERTRERLGQDDAYLEELARAELGLVYRDEVIYRFGDQRP